ncbi:RDD family protein [Stigmatella sp. ncwal1]|uniref:RDD family protein n=1 Tax=Stigmatella ashevillensis TaxID=2995309 RepID=A0ABT5DHZ2_9BACT|nr:RDD family protein [Stigmatella ashevillena]MDC0712383.1 RDD family protein [Stigmatella ashevillena]
MSEGALFASHLGPTHTRFRFRLWAADLLDLGTAGVLGWGASRALDLEQTPAYVLATLGSAWLLVALLGGLRGWTLGRRLFDVRLVSAQGTSPGVFRALVRALTTLPDVFMVPLLPARPLDRLLQLHGERPAPGTAPRVKGLAWQLPWVAALAAALGFIAVPTRHEAFAYLDLTLTGWKCCHGYRRHTDTWMCQRSLARLVRETRAQTPEAQPLIAQCPEASAHLKP